LIHRRYNNKITFFNFITCVYYSAANACVDIILSSMMLLQSLLLWSFNRNFFQTRTIITIIPTKLLRLPITVTIILTTPASSDYTTTTTNVENPIRWPICGKSITLFVDMIDSCTTTTLNSDGIIAVINQLQLQLQLQLTLDGRNKPATTTTNETLIPHIRDLSKFHSLKYQLVPNPNSEKITRPHHLIFNDVTTKPIISIIHLNVFQTNTIIIIYLQYFHQRAIVSDCLQQYTSTLAVEKKRENNLSLFLHNSIF